MGIGICPRCQQRYSFDDLTNSDIIHTCNSGKPVLDQDDVLVIGNWEEGNESGTVGKHSAQMKSMNNKLQLSRTKIEDGTQLDDKSPRGANKSTTRLSQHDEYINLKSNC